jgi:uncharacterized damage-inducible protein DinB
MPKTSRKSARKTKSASSRKAAMRKRTVTRKKTTARKRPAAASSRSSSAAPLSALFPDLEGELATTRRMLERVPNGNDDWRPHAKSRSLGELATHLAQLPGFAMMMLTREEFDAFASRPPDPTFTSSVERVKLFDQLSAQLKGLLQKMTWDQANQTWTLRAGGGVALQAPRSTVIRTAFITHSAHHRAQIGVYLRMLEVPVPWTYGRSADEMPEGPM